ncbi:ATP-binding protein [Deltaproteobacteria bacterium PRO3]|nr:ATP-binding protein [Deltaproteobacteria bacterium PRO3]
MNRTDYYPLIDQAFRVTPIVALLGPRQSGKTTLAKQYIARDVSPHSGPAHFFDLEDPVHLGRLQNAKLALENLQGLVVLDEIQREPDLFPVLRVLADRAGAKTKFLILGSASRDLIQQSSETLAGRITFLDVYPFSLTEVGLEHQDRLWVRGGFPRSYLAEDDALSAAWREGYIRTYLERDIPQLGIRIPAPALRRFWMMLAHYHGQIFQASEIGRSLDKADTTIKNYLDVLVGTFMIRRLDPWYENIGKRQVKRPKIYFRDSGIFHQLLGIADYSALQVHPKLGASWEGFALEEVARFYRATDEEIYFWSVHGQMELDLLLIRGGKRLGFEVKFSQSPKVTEAHRKIVSLLNLEKLVFVVPGEERYPVDEKLEVCGLLRMLKNGRLDTADPFSAGDWRRPGKGSE